LEVFLAEKGDIRLHQVEQFRDNRRHAREMTRPKSTAKNTV
jgi:hypothetical protein